MADPVSVELLSTAKECNVSFHRNPWIAEVFLCVISTQDLKKKQVSITKWTTATQYELEKKLSPYHIFIAIHVTCTLGSGCDTASLHCEVTFVVSIRRFTPAGTTVSSSNITSVFLDDSNVTRL